MNRLLTKLGGRNDSSPETLPPPNLAADSNKEEDGFILLGQSASEQSTIMPSSSVPINGHSVAPPGIAPPPPYDQVTRSPSLPPASVTLPYPSQPLSPVSSAVPSTRTTMNHLQGHIDNRTVHPAHAANSTSPSLNRSGNSNWGILDVPFQLSPLLCESRPSATDFDVAELRQVDWDVYNYDFQFELNVKRESEQAQEDEDYIWHGDVS